MALFLRAALFCCALLLAAVPAHAEGFLDAVEDMPLMEGLAETGDGGIVFDKPAGRIVRSVAEGDVAPPAVRAFYIETLPQLGWTRAAEYELIGELLLFRREGEQLEIQIVPVSQSHTEVRFSIEPQ
ncbi:hypothetical protein [Parvibaculum sp.]|jgi:hypothetical protein|uniref:hypothetical protein n=1 Tax=Parvibaculum sp. TaxID=2024848 RepID=UPI001B29CB3C|nr:hypothetical protein [Parvibaculum sp.]MBO6636033.1 hypothetical protein [Parvibaculum sp.]MBO6677597.1 hypothetical protein [Parvibaculum sp.]MBO6684303.1 hypothetical protein [Parvibaculum sp.]MBO6905621.1 hypothetical protein [Parvibaculum sp.]